MIDFLSGVEVLTSVGNHFKLSKLHWVRSERASKRHTLWIQEASNAQMFICNTEGIIESGVSSFPARNLVVEQIWTESVN